MGAPAPTLVELSFTVEEPHDRLGRWWLEDEDVPESPLHDAIIELLMLVLKHEAEASGRSALVCSNLGCRWDPDDGRVGTDPDVVLVEPRPSEGESLTTLRVWEPGHAPPRVAVEVVSEHHPEKDYLDAPLRCARLGARELWVFDPKRVGPRDTGGPFRLQVWRRESEADRPTMRRTYAGPGPAFSEELAVWLVVTQDGTRLRPSRDPDGRALWPTAREAERDRANRAQEHAIRERERANRERERANRERERADRLAAELRRRGFDPVDD